MKLSSMTAAATWTDWSGVLREQKLFKDFLPRFLRAVLAITLLPTLYATKMKFLGVLLSYHLLEESRAYHGSQHCPVLLSP